MIRDRKLDEMKKKKKKDWRNILIIAASEHDANLYYATRFTAPDPFVFAQIRGKKYVLMSDLEVDRARSQASAHRVFSISKLKEQYQKKARRPLTLPALIARFLKSHRIRQVLVPENFGIRHADALRKKGIKIKPAPGPLFPQRTQKTAREVRAIRKTIRHIETAFREAVKVLKDSAVKKGRLYRKGKPLTSEAVRKIINLKLMAAGCVALHTIVACGKHSVDPHHEGSGPLYAHKPIIVDIFPRDSHSRYFGDFTRTVVRGRASAKLKRMYAAVKKAQDFAFRNIRDGADAGRIHLGIQERFEKQGFRTGLIRGRMQGFFHGSGHGLGLDLHEPPNLKPYRDILKAGQVLTVEPGLYYRGTGGVRLEDVVVVTRTGCKNLTRFPKVLEI